MNFEDYLSRNIEAYDKYRATRTSTDVCCRNRLHYEWYTLMELVIMLWNPYLVPRNEPTIPEQIQLAKRLSISLEELMKNYSIAENELIDADDWKCIFRTHFGDYCVELADLVAMKRVSPFRVFVSDRNKRNKTVANL